MRAEAFERRAEDAEVALRGDIEENFRLLAIQEAQAAKIKKLKVQLAKVEKLEAKVEKNKITLTEENSRDLEQNGGTDQGCHFKGH